MSDATTTRTICTGREKIIAKPADERGKMIILAMVRRLERGEE